MEGGGSFICGSTAGGVSVIHQLLTLFPQAWVANYEMSVLRYMMLAVVIGYPANELRINPTASNVCAFVFIGASHGASVLIAFAHQRQLVFLLHSIFM